MSRKIEKLLHIVSEMRMLDKDNAIEKKQSIHAMCGELTDSELDMVAAALNEPSAPGPFKKVE